MGVFLPQVDASLTICHVLKMCDVQWVISNPYVMICSVPEEVQPFDGPQVALWQQRLQKSTAD